jgi:hypothetical protein
LEAGIICMGYTLEQLVVVIGNIVNKSQEEKYKILKMDNQTLILILKDMVLASDY